MCNGAFLTSNIQAGLTKPTLGHHAACKFKRKVGGAVVLVVLSNFKPIYTGVRVYPFVGSEISTIGGHGGGKFGGIDKMSFCLKIIFVDSVESLLQCR